MLAEAAGPDQRVAKKMRPGHCTKKIHPGSPQVTFLGTDTSFAQSHPALLFILTSLAYPAEKILDRRQLFFLANCNSPEQTPHTRLNLNG